MKIRPNQWIMALVVATSLGCELTPPAAWASMTFPDVTYSDMFSVVLTTLNGEGYVAVKRDPETGTIETDWLYGQSQAKVRGPSRRRVVIHIDPEGPNQVVRLRVVEEVIWKAGMRATNLRESDEWEIADDNFEEAEFLLARVRGVMSTHVE
jgi:hypothetical protein